LAEAILSHSDPFGLFLLPIAIGIGARELTAAGVVTTIAAAIAANAEAIGDAAAEVAVRIADRV